MTATPTAVVSFSEGLARLRADASRYDQGDTRAASAIAATLCLMFDDGWQSSSLMSQLGAPGLALLSTLLGLPEGTSESSQSLSCTEPVSHAGRPRLDEFRDCSRLVPWASWWDEEPAYLTSAGSVTRADLARGAATWYGGFRIAVPLNKTGRVEFVPLLVAGEDEEWPPSPTHLADVRQICHEVLNSPAFDTLCR